MKTNKMHLWLLIIAIGLTINLFSTVRAQSGYDPTIQTQALAYDEAQTVYLGNIARQNNGIPPLRWNLQLTHGARWFAWDSTENRPSGYCGHQDTLGGWPNNRALTFGYLGFAGAENAFCGYVSPEYAIQGWMNSPGHKANLLDAGLREVGLGYYRRNSDGRGYVVQAFGNDPVYTPIIVENEAISTTNPNVNLYIYNREASSGFTELDTATQMMVSNNPRFCGATWEPFNSNKAWQLTPGAGWRDVYVRSIDKFNRSSIVSDSIYLGANVPMSEIGDAQMSTTASQVTIYNLNGGGYPQVQFSPGWLADDTNGTFDKLWGNGERVNDADAWGGTAFRLYPGNGESFAWVYEYGFPINTPLVAYFRIKVDNNFSNSEVARITVEGGNGSTNTIYGSKILKGTDFSSANQYQEFAINFTFNSSDTFLFFNFWRSGSVDIYIDAVSIYSAPQTVASPLIWSIPGGNYRGQGLWARYTNGVQFSERFEASTLQDTSCTVAISGNTGIGGATISYFDGSQKIVTADASGNYSFRVPFGWSGTLTPNHLGFTFTPVNRTYVNVVKDQLNQSFMASWVGSVTVTSDKALVAVARPHIGNEVASYDSFSTGATSAFVPMLFKDAFGGSYDAALYIQNVHASNTATVSIKYYDNAGVLNCTKTDTLAPLASKGYWLPSASCDSGSLPTGWVGGVVVSSDQPVVAVGRPHIGAEVMTYNGFSSGSLSAFIPMLFKGAFGGSYNSAFYIQNVHASNSANLTIQYYDNAGNLNCTKSDTLSPLASKGYWVPSAICDIGALPTGWVGGVVVSSDQPIVTVGRPHIGSQVTTYDGFASGTANAFVPMLFKGAFGGSYDSAFYIQNVHVSNSANLTIQYYDNAGNLSCIKSDTLAPLASKGYWVPATICDTGALPAGWVGGLIVSSDQPIVAVGRPHIGSQVTTYNGFSSGNVNAFLSMLFKDAFGGSYDSAFYLQNTEANSATVMIRFYDSSGILTCSRTDTIAPKATLGFWLPSIICIP